MIAGIPSADAISDAWTAYSTATQTLVAMERGAAPSASRAIIAMKAHRLHRAFLLMSELAEIGEKLGHGLSIVPAAVRGQG